VQILARTLQAGTQAKHQRFLFTLCKVFISFAFSTLASRASSFFVFLLSFPRRGFFACSFAVSLSLQTHRGKGNDYHEYSRRNKFDSLVMRVKRDSLLELTSKARETERQEEEEDSLDLFSFLCFCRDRFAYLRFISERTEPTRTE
jgi:hypothetical protein